MYVLYRSFKSNFFHVHTLLKLLEIMHWSPEDKGEFIAIENRFEIAYVGSDEIENIIRTTESIHKTSTSFYFEIKIKNCGSNGVLAIGLTQADPKTRSGCFPGWAIHSTLGIGYHGDVGGIFHENNVANDYAEPFTTGDVVGCFVCQALIDDEQITLVQFTKNGEKLSFPRLVKNAEWYPTIGVGSPGALIHTNFGEETFVCDPKGTYSV